MQATLIQNLNQFLDALNLCETGILSYEEVFKTGIVEPQDVLKYESWEESGYTKNLILEKDGFQIYLLCLLPGQMTEIHNCDGDAWTYITSGQMTREIYRFDESLSPMMSNEERTMLDEKSSTKLSGKNEFHRLINKSNSSSTCLYMFVPPANEVQFYNESTDSIRRDAFT